MTTTEVKIMLRKAEPDDLKIDDKTLRFGTPYWIRSMKTGKFDNRHYIINADTDVSELAQYLMNDMIYVPVSSLDID